jgi:hypothetical protein
MKMLKDYPLARNGGIDPVWWSLQGEAHLRGFQMAFIRFEWNKQSSGDRTTPSSYNKYIVQRNESE